MKDTKLTLLQYNVQKSQSVQELLLATSAVQEVDIIALQEFWKNPHIETSTLTVFSSFFSLYCSEIGRTLFLINKNLKLSSLHPTFWSKDFVSLEIYLQNYSTSLWVHNLYFTPSSQENYTEASEALLSTSKYFTRTRTIYSPHRLKPTLSRLVKEKKTVL